MCGGRRVWGGDWRARIRSRVIALGCETVTEYLALYPSEPYVAAAQRLGDDVAALQLEQIHFAEGDVNNRIRSVAMDSLSRDLNRHLPSGWRAGALGDFDTSGACAEWITRLVMHTDELKLRANAVWDALEQSKPPKGWSPGGPNDPLIVAAFEKGWPDHES